MAKFVVRHTSAPKRTVPAPSRAHAKKNVPSPTPAAKKPSEEPKRLPLKPPSPPPKTPYDPEVHCGAQLRRQERGRLCRQFKGAKTPHIGVGKCWLHGGLTPIVHGLNSLIKHGRLKDMMAAMKDIDHDVMDLTPEVELLRAMTIDFVNRYDTFTETLDAWYTALDAKRKEDDLPPVPRKYPTLEDAGSLLESISRMVERMHKITREGSITLDVFRALMSQMGMVVSECVKDDSLLQLIEDKWSKILVNPKSFIRGGTKSTLTDEENDDAIAD